LKKQAYKILMLSKIAINKRIHFNWKCKTTLTNSLTSCVDL
jgi:hypothetical protein